MRCSSGLLGSKAPTAVPTAQKAVRFQSNERIVAVRSLREDDHSLLRQLCSPGDAGATATAPASATAASVLFASGCSQSALHTDPDLHHVLLVYFHTYLSIAPGSTHAPP
jgi:hypothetical protein